MKLEENVRLARLYDLYKNLLSPSQREIMDAYLNFNLTTSEIAENRSTTRQAVNDAIEKAGRRLEEYENKLGFLERVDGHEKLLKRRK